MQRGKPEPEVIVNFVDGLAYNKIKLEAAVFGGTVFSNRPPLKAASKNPLVKDEDVNLVVRELDMPKHAAEQALIDADGDVVKALERSIGLASVTALS